MLREWHDGQIDKRLIGQSRPGAVSCGSLNQAVGEIKYAAALVMGDSDDEKPTARGFEIEEIYTRPE